MMRLRIIVAGGAMLLASFVVAAQDGMNDPTRPPAILSAPFASGTPRASGLPVVQSILVSQRSGGRRVAVIDGKTLRQGERLGGALVETIRATEVVLRHGNKRSTLKLFRPHASVAAVQP